MHKKALGALLKRARKEAQFSQKEVAERLGVSQENISSWERGRTEPSIEFLIKALHVYNKDLQWREDGISNRDEVVVVGLLKEILKTAREQKEFMKHCMKSLERIESAECPKDIRETQVKQIKKGA